MKTYISGPISGKPNQNRESFLNAEIALLESGHEVENPIHNPYPTFLPDKLEAWQYQMRKAMAQLAKCDSILMLDGWEDSKGANTELYIAKLLGFKIYNHKLKEVEIDWEKISMPDWQAVQDHLNRV